MYRNYFFQFAFTLSLFLTISIANAQDSINENSFFISYPESGSWFAMDGSSTGFSFDIQQGQLAGTYLGYDNNGDSTWFVFSGELEPVFDQNSSNIQIGWELETSLDRYINGGCIFDCNQAQNIFPSKSTVASITFQFNGRSIGNFSVDGNTPTEIIPLYFGNSASIRETPMGLTAQPDLEGKWVVAVGTGVRNADQSIAEIDFIESAGFFEIGNQISVTNSGFSETNGAGVTTIQSTNAFILRDTTGLLPEDATIVCIFDDSRAVEQSVNCFVQMGILNSIPLSNNTSTIDSMMVPIQMMSDSRFVMYITPPPGDDSNDEVITIRLEAFRVNYD